MIKSKSVKTVVGKKEEKHMDILVRLRDFWISFIFWLNPSITSFILRMGVMLCFVFILVALFWLNPYSRSVFLQLVFASMGIFISLYFPVDVFRTGKPGSFAFIVTFFFLCMIFMPRWIAFFLVPVFRLQELVTKIIISIIWVLFVCQIIVR